MSGSETKPPKVTAEAALAAWRDWRKAESAYNRATKDVDDNWSPEISRAFDAARVAEHDARRLAWRLLDAASLRVSGDGVL